MDNILYAVHLLLGKTVSWKTVNEFYHNHAERQNGKFSNKNLEPSGEGVLSVQVKHKCD